MAAMSGARPRDRDSARQLIAGILKEHGCPPQEVLERMLSQDRQIIEECLLQKDRMIGSSVTTLARNLYTSSARFVFELLQNADDNHYTAARAAGEPPQVSFHVYDNHIVIDCNEDGFTDKNLTAISKVGASSKSGAQGYIGEKGIGFKSVFMAAHKVIIQSGHFSFFFQHRKGDSGMGMITPIWHEQGAYLGDKITRMTMVLLEDSTAEETTRQRGIIREEFLGIHDTILLFMNNLRKITLSFQLQARWHGAVSKTTTSRTEDDKEDIRYYHTTKHLATDLPKSENRTYSVAEEESKSYSTAEIVLAFPLTANSVPLPDHQCVFAFLPIRKTGFKFLIQADFVTQANRQDIVTTSARNIKLLCGIADAFIKAVLALCKHKSLQYQWMRYLPVKEDRHSDFWTELVDLIKERMGSTPILRPESPNGPLKLISMSRAHPSDETDEHGKPLLRDSSPFLYLSLNYLWCDLKILSENFELQYSCMDEFICRAKHDLTMSESRIKSIADPDWQSRVAKLLRRPFAEEGWSLEYPKAVKSLNLVPLRDGSWTSVKAGAVHYPEVEGTNLEVPIDLHYRIVSPAALANADRKRLFDALGVQTTTVSMVSSDIEKLYANTTPMVTLTASVYHLKFAYLTQHLVKSRRKMYRQFNLFDEHNHLVCPDHNDPTRHLYIRDEDDPFGAASLLAKNGTAASAESGFKVQFLNEAYFIEAPKPPSAHKLSWNHWLISCFRLQDGIRLAVLCSNGPGWVVSPACQYVAKNRPDKFLGLLRVRWTAEISVLTEQDAEAIAQEIGNFEVPCESHGKTWMEPISNTYLPLEDLVTLVNRFVAKEDAQHFPWLKLEQPLSHGTMPTEWEAVGKSFGLGFDRNMLYFALNILRNIVINSSLLTRSLASPKGLLQLYAYLQSQAEDFHDPEAGRKLIRDYFASNTVIFADLRWVKSEDCLWEAPIPLNTKVTLTEVFGCLQNDLSRLRSFFVGTLNIPNCTWENIVEEIRYAKAALVQFEFVSGFDRICALYKCLDDMKLFGVSAEKLKETFDRESLIRGEINEKVCWFTTGECLWSSATDIKGTFTLGDTYPDLEGFFVKTLGVREMTPEMVYDKLRGSDKLTIDDAKQTLLAFNSYLASGAGAEFKPKPVLCKKIFPVRYADGKVRLRTGNKDFALLDRKPFGDAFDGVAKFLDFSMDEVHSFGPFVKWAGLETKYLSSSVKEITSADGKSTRPLSDRSRHIRCKAHGLLRIAVTYNSPRTKTDQDQQVLYALLRSSQTFETDKITSELLLNQDGAPLRVEIDAATLHIDETENKLTVYVPENTTLQERCYNSKLPRRLCEWMLTDPKTLTPSDELSPDAVMAVQSVLNCSKSFALPDILDDLGIINVEIPNEDETPQNDEESGKLSGTAMVKTDQSTSEPATEGRLLLPTTVSRNNTQGEPYDMAFPTPGYTNLLDSVVQKARKTPLPDNQVFNMSSMQAALVDAASTMVPSTRNSSYTRSTSQVQRDMKHGAAGELFVFELLSNLNPPLPNFSEANWTSSIRGAVTQHPDYSNMGSWNGREIADITYEDTEGVFTNFLVEKGYMEREPWYGMTGLKYLIEVKSTTRECSTPFFMSKEQYELMQRSSLSSGVIKELYVIFRVYNLGTDKVSCKVLFDPVGLKARGQLHFTAESWSVVTP